jgi:hypothetical protein
MSTCKQIAVALAAMLLVAFSVHQAVARNLRTVDPLLSFSITVNASGPGIAATCRQGCTWNEVSATYPGGSYRITEQGIQPVQGEVRSVPERPESGGFSVVLRTSGGSISATCADGCAWKSVSATYPTNRYQITEQGVGPARQHALTP